MLVEAVGAGASSPPPEKANATPAGPSAQRVGGSVNIGLGHATRLTQVQTSYASARAVLNQALYHTRVFRSFEGQRIHSLHQRETPSVKPLSCARELANMPHQETCSRIAENPITQ